MSTEPPPGAVPPASSDPGGTGLLTVTGGRAAYPIRDFLTRNNVGFRYLDDPAAAGRADAEDGTHAVCTWPDGTVLTDPSIAELAERLGLRRPARFDVYDLVIVGAGPAGLAAAVYGASEGLSTALVESSAPGGQAGTSSRIENYLGFPDGIGGADLAGRASAQARRLGADLLLAREVVRGDFGDRLFRLTMADGEQLAGRTVLSASGVDWRRHDAHGIDRLLHAGVYYGAAASEARGTAGKDVFVVGAGNSAGQAAVNFAAHARTVTLLVRGPDPATSMSTYLLDQLHALPRVRVLTEVTLTAVDGDDWLREITLDQRGSGRTTVAAHALFLCIGGEPRTAWAIRNGLVRDAAGYLVTGDDLPRPLADLGWPLTRDPYPLETNRPGMFVAGDVRHGSTKRVATAVGEGAMAVQLVHRHLAALEERSPGRTRGPVP